MTQAPLPPSKVRPEAELPLAFEAIVLRCMAKNPKRRFASMAEVAEALQAVDAGPADSEGQADEAARAAWAEPDLPAAIPARDTPKAVEETRRGPPTFLFVAAAVGLLGGLVASAVIVLRGEDPPAHEALARADGTAPPMASEQALATPPPRAEVASTAVTEPGAPSPPARSEILELASTPEGAEVYEDGALLGRTPLRVARPAEGERLALEVRQAGFTPHPLVLSALSADEVRISLTPAAHPRAAQPEARPPEPATEPPSGGAPPPPAQRHREFRDPWAQ